MGGLVASQKRRGWRFVVAVEIRLDASFGRDVVGSCPVVASKWVRRTPSVARAMAKAYHAAICAMMGMHTIRLRPLGGAAAAPSLVLSTGPAPTMCLHVERGLDRHGHGPRRAAPSLRATTTSTRRSPSATSAPARRTSGMPCRLRVRPEVVTGRTVPAQFAGGIFDLLPGTAYDNRASRRRPGRLCRPAVKLTGSTRPSRPTRRPAPVAVSGRGRAEHGPFGAKAGEVDHACRRERTRQLSISASGTAADPIVIRGTTQDGTILAVAGAIRGNVLEVYGSFVHVERLTLAHARAHCAFREAAEATSCAAYTEGHGARHRVEARSEDFYLSTTCSRDGLAWPAVYAERTGAFTPTTTGSPSGTGTSFATTSSVASATR